MSTAPNAPGVSPTDTSASVPDLLEVIEQKDHLIAAHESVLAERDRLIAEQQKLLALMEE